MIRTAGVVLCGGRSSRMGRPKAWLPFAGELMLPRVVRLLGEVVAPVIVVAAPEQEVPPLPPGVLVVRDAEQGRGPLQGILAGLSALAGVEVAYVSSCDVPLLAPAFVRRLVALLGDHAAVVPQVGGRLHPLAAVYRLTIIPTVERLLAAGRFRVTSLFDEVPTRLVGEADLSDVDPNLATLRNLNTPEEFEAVAREVGHYG